MQRSAFKKLAIAALIGGALAVAPTAAAHAGNVSDVNAHCFRPWLSETADWGVAAYFYGGGSHAGLHNAQASLYYRGSTFLRGLSYRHSSPIVSVTSTYNPVWGGSNFNVNAVGFADGSGGSMSDTCYIT